MWYDAAGRPTATPGGDMVGGGGASWTDKKEVGE